MKIEARDKTRTDQFDYELPPELIAQEPLIERDSSRLLVLNRRDGQLEHSSFKILPGYLDEGDLLILNNTRVFPARFIGKRRDTGGRIEILLLRRLEDARWEVLCSPGKRALPGTELIFGDGALSARVLEKTEPGGRVIVFSAKEPLNDVLHKLGQVPLPPYIKKQLDDHERYQTVYASNEGSAAAPTAGLHFTPALFKELEERGIKTAALTLHIGVGTFRPVKDDYIEDHIMHSECYELSASVAHKINSTKEKGKRIVAVGTTCCRVLETLSDENGAIREGQGETKLFIYPGYRFKTVDALITNFHLPRSTLLMLISAFAGREDTLKAYNIAVEERYRFFSFGDSMLIV
ncbi:MAG: tRNA preQ1(34) S-adenosylmethionine ribosyltransferase-isomerase QueA [Bacillota bacterium]|nr:tRNA preQ1(34) S-adenosylmethionine ribosyltransferase-isomerase QueA [Bacillota bacterium]